MTVSCALEWACALLKPCEFITRARLEAEILLSDLLQCERIYLHTHDSEELLARDSREFTKRVERRAQGVPIEYITQKVSFYSHTFHIESGVLIPRPETEILVERASQIIAANKARRVAEVGIGSGIISCSLAMLHKEVQFCASDISPKALEVARKNIEHFGLSSRIELFCASLLSPLHGSFDLLVSNPPYIAHKTPLPKPLAYEPPEALFGGNRGSEILEMLITQAQERAIPVLIAEMGYDQKEAIAEFLSRGKYKKLEFYEDLAGLPRGFVVEFF